MGLESRWRGRYRFDVYRLGWYGGLGARRLASFRPMVGLPQEQPECFKDHESLLVDCGTWAPSGDACHRPLIEIARASRCHLQAVYRLLTRI